MDMSLRDIEMTTINLTPDKVQMQGDTVLVQYIVQSWELQKYEGGSNVKLFTNYNKCSFRWDSWTNKTGSNSEKKNNQWAINNLLANSPNSVNCLCYKFLQAFFLWIHNIYKPHLTPGLDNSLHLRVPTTATNSLCQDDRHLAYFCSTNSISRGQFAVSLSFS